MPFQERQVLVYRDAPRKSHFAWALPDEEMLDDELDRIERLVRTGKLLFPQDTPRYRRQLAAEAGECSQREELLGPPELSSGLERRWEWTRLRLLGHPSCRAVWHPRARSEGL